MYVFPLHTVLFPGAVLPLRIFEARYLRMLSEVMQNDSSFAIHLIRGEGQEAGEPSDCFELGCEVKVVDFDQEASGILNVLVQVVSTIKIISRKVEKDGLLFAEIEPFINVAEEGLPSPYASMPKILKQMQSEIPSASVDMLIGPQAKAISELSVDELVYRLCHIAPLSNYQKQALLECPSDMARLALLHDYFSNIKFSITA